MSIISSVKNFLKIKEYFHIAFTYITKSLDGTEYYMNTVKYTRWSVLFIPHYKTKYWESTFKVVSSHISKFSLYPEHAW